MSSITYNNDVNINTGYKLTSNGEIIISNRISSLGYQLNSTSVGTSVSTSLKVLNKRTRTSRGTAVKSIESWNTRTVTTNSLFRIAWSPQLSLFAAVPYIGTSLNTSPDGINWTTRTSPTSGYDITWSPENNKFVMVNYTGTNSTTNNIVSSTDGITWTQQTTPSSVGFKGICWAAELGLFVACSDTSPYILTSPNGNSGNWTAVTGPGQGYAICWSSELKIFIVLGNDVIYRSSNSINWNTNFGSVTISQLVNSDVCWVDELYTFVVANGNNNILTSSDGINWNTSSTLTGYLVSCAWSPDLSIILVGNNNGSLYYSSDAVNWTEFNIPGGASLGMCWSKELSIFAITNISSAIL